MSVAFRPDSPPARRTVVAEESVVVLAPDAVLFTTQRRLTAETVEFFRAGGVAGPEAGLPAATRFPDGSTWITDGNHRIAAAQAGGRPLTVELTRLVTLERRPH